MNVSGITIRDRVTAARHRLKAAGIADAEADIDTRLLAQHVLRWETARLFTDDDRPANAAFDAAFERLVARRERREPIAYILGHQDFWDLTFEVTPDVLIPRPETELLVELAVGHLSQEAPLTLADVGTGSGCIAVSLAHTFSRARVVATDTSAAALEVARRNAERHGVTGRITFRQTSLLDAIDDRFDFIACNPPYVPEADRSNLQQEVRDHEPRTALFGGRDGLDVIRRLLAMVPARLQPDGLLAFEFGFGQADQVTSLIDHTPAVDLVGISSDLQGIPRAAVLKRR